MTDRCSCDKCKLCGAGTDMSHVVPLAVPGSSRKFQKRQAVRMNERNTVEKDGHESGRQEGETNKRQKCRPAALFIVKYEDKSSDRRNGSLTCRI
jgi:hypothetical protein